MYTRHATKRGFSLVELLIVMAIIGILAGIIYANFGASNAVGRDAKRQADLKILQNAIEQYKTKYGQYPARGCSVGGTNFANERDCPEYIVGLTPEFLPRLPKDSRRGTNEGFSYITNNQQTVYKAMVMRTVESETVTDKHPLKSCDVLHQGSTGEGSNDINVAGWCTRVHFQSSNIAPNCRNTSNNRFLKSYGVWGGIAALRSGDKLVGDSTDIARVQDTTNVICR